jgi:ATP-dependent Lon protease
MNPLILLDELDKVSGDTGLRADMMAILLEILDPEQNTSFRDHYVDYPIDLSSVLFIVSANNTGTFSAALMDRLEIIRMPSYTDEEKKVIARDYLLPRVIVETGLSSNQLVFEPEVWDLIIRPLGFDSGIRSLKKNLDAMARKAARKVVSKEVESVLITKDNFKDYLPSYY